MGTELARCPTMRAAGGILALLVRRWKMPRTSGRLDHAASQIAWALRLRAAARRGRLGRLRDRGSIESPT